LKIFLVDKEIAKYKLPERLEILAGFPAIDIRKSIEEAAR